MRILVVKLGSIGDIVHTLPALAAIRRAQPTAEIGWVVEARSAEILRGNLYIDHLIEVDTSRLRQRMSVDELLRELRSQVSEIRKLKFDIALDFQGLIKSAIVAKLSGAKRRWGFAGRARREPASRVFLTDTVKVPKGTHVIQKNLMLARAAFGMAGDDGSLEFPIAISAIEINEASAVVGKVGDRFAILNPGGGWVTKLWPAENYGVLADRLWTELGVTSILVTGPAESTLAARALGASHSGKLIAAEPSLKGLVELAKHATVYVGGDTGPTHLALAAGTPVVGIFGPTEWWRNGSIRPDDICVERTDIDCRIDCHRRRCSNWICMDIGVERVFQAARERIIRAGNSISNNLNGKKAG
ncbi:MAG TPA: lipopolysaccharide heptosyltransferase I [Pyrinomonadaceae bacterium]|nr:lipopolysaccharide heptosyltransferase I [Pyrinomonadaceae bacterium]